MGMTAVPNPGLAAPEVMLDVNTTPLIDVLLVLLVMLIITIPMQLHAVTLDLPAGLPPQSIKPPEVVELFIDFDGEVSWNGLVVSPAALEQRLADLAQLPSSDQAEIHIKPNSVADYGHVAAVMASVQRHGLTKMGMVGQERFAH